MSSFSFPFKIAAFALVFAVSTFFCYNSHAIQVQALYRSACERDIGVILNVTDREISLLLLSGEVKNIPRYEIIYLVGYSVDQVPVEKVVNVQTLPPFYRIESYQDGNYVELVRGWPVAFTKERIAFLSTSGNENLILRRSMWRISRGQVLENREFGKRQAQDFNFAHPQIFAHCEKREATKHHNVAYPQQLLGDPVIIKRELDALRAGHKALERNEKDQQFYPVPEVYENRTSLGLWLNAQSRYGASSGRTNNFTPLLTDDFSSGPFGFQRRFVTGAGPIENSIHEEAQTQVSYQFKADYFHFAAMIDASTILVGSSYDWERSDFKTLDGRAIETSHLILGFDYGRWAVDLLGTSALHVAARVDSEFHSEHNIGVGRFGIYYQLPWTKFAFYLGRGDDLGFEFEWYRMNFSHRLSNKSRAMLSYIMKKQKYDGFIDDTDSARPDFILDTESMTLAGYYYYSVRPRHEVGGFISSEKVENRLSSPEHRSSDEMFLKLGIMSSLSF